MVNAISIATEFLGILPPEETPQQTEGREGFFHVHHLKGEIEHAEFEMIIRDHDEDQFKKRKQLILDISRKLNSMYGDCIDLVIEDQYRNMREKIEPMMHIVDTAKRAMEAVGVRPVIKPIRGGTDGSQLSYMGGGGAYPAPISSRAAITFTGNTNMYRWRACRKRWRLS